MYIIPSNTEIPHNRGNSNSLQTLKGDIGTIERNETSDETNFNYIVEGKTNLITTIPYRKR